jgi:transcriptional regulator with XRE-family HTH domain
MKRNLAIALDMSGRPSAPKPPVSYGRLLQEHREALGLSRVELGKLAGVDDVTVLRNETGMVERSVKASSKMRDALVERGRHVPPVPVGDDAEWSAPIPTGERPREDPSEENIRRNLIRAREALELDQFAAAHATGLAYAEIRAYELGEETPSGGALRRFGDAYGCEPGDFFKPEAPKVNRDRTRQLWYGGANTQFMTDEERSAIEKIFATVTARTRSAKSSSKKSKRSR